MARKDLLKNLMNPSSPPDDTRPVQRSDRGAIGAVSKSINELRSRAIIEVAPDMIDDAGIADRMDHDAAGIDALRESIREYGQQVPVLLRPSPDVDGRYEVVFGRRRVEAMRGLRMPVRAMVRHLDDKALVVAQGQENSARKDLSFIEKANFAAQMVKAGFERKVICDALSIDKTVISRMLSVTDAVPEAIIRAIGAAPAAGRDRWLSLAARMKGQTHDSVIAAAQGEDSDARFAAALAFVTSRNEKPAALPLQDQDIRLGSASRGRSKNVIELSGDGKEFGDWLIENIQEVHRSWLRSRSGSGD
ncbi:plasmid partitioning protein RepB [Paracoccus beibuensis]|uniref:plasmid partitioning protein RepB n=1 Tax=Paracoccus beibuensis TaxID=547602 RepID=UPI002240A2A1|nr:plasmid partitioning protein RepB [Paracoccus beibuensis]